MYQSTETIIWYPLHENSVLTMQLIINKNNVYMYAINNNVITAVIKCS